MSSENRVIREPRTTTTTVIVVNRPGAYWSSYYDTTLEHSWQSPGQSYSDTFHRMLRQHENAS